MLEMFLPTCLNRLEFDSPAGVGEDPIKVLRRDFVHPFYPLLRFWTRVPDGKQIVWNAFQVNSVLPVRISNENILWLLSPGPWVDVLLQGAVPSGRRFAQKDPIYQSGDRKHPH